MSLTHLAIELFFISSGTLAICVTVHSLKRSHDKLLAFLTNQVSDAEQSPYDLVTCGGCGRTVETVDGFNPVYHNCDGVCSDLLAK